MDQVTNSEFSEEYGQVKAFITDFFRHYFTERDCEATTAVFADHIMFTGLLNDEIVHDRASAEQIIRSQMNGVSRPIPYFVNDYVQSYYGRGLWHCYVMLDMNVVLSAHGTSRYHVRITISVLKTEDGYQITAYHVSESNSLRNSRARFDKISETAKNAAQRELGRIMSQVIPGGIVSRYATPGSPVSIVNDQYLRMLHFNTFYDLIEACDGLYERHIHPDDLEKFQYTKRFIMTSGKQCECEYRIQRSDGSYLWVLDTGRKAAATDGRDLIVSVLTDISNQVEHTHRLERENEVDALTSIYNRRGALNHFFQRQKPYRNYALCIIDVDNFKLINDLYGHKQGDRILVYLAELLELSFGKDGIVCRLGGDEFCVFIPDFPDIGYLRSHLEDISRIFTEKARQQCPDARSSLSIGCVYGIPPLDIGTVFDAADINLYQIKNKNKNGICMTEISGRAI